MTRSDVGKGHPEYYQDMAQRIAARHRGAFFATSSATRRIRTRTRPAPARRSGQQMDHESTRSCSASARRGTLTGLTRFFRARAAATSLRARRSGRLDPRAIHEDGHARQGRVVGRRGHRRGLPSAIADLSGVKQAYSIPRRRRASATARELLQHEGILGGSSTGTLLAAALRYCREQTEPKRVVSFVCDTGTSTCRRCTTTTGWSTRACSARALRRPARPDRAPRRGRHVVSVGRTTRC